MENTLVFKNECYGFKSCKKVMYTSINVNQYKPNFRLVYAVVSLFLLLGLVYVDDVTLCEILSFLVNMEFFRGLDANYVMHLYRNIGLLELENDSLTQETRAVIQPTVL